MPKSNLTRQELKSAIIGMVLGDGNLTQNRFQDGIYRGNALFRCSHSLKQWEYLEWKKNLIQQLFGYPLKIKKVMVKNQRIGKIYPVCSLVTKVHPRLTQIFRMTYKNGKKVITKDILNRLTPLAIAIWYMDDGFLGINRKKQWKVVGLSTNSFNYEENCLIRDWFNEKYSILFNVTRTRSKQEKDRRITYFLRKGLSEGYKFLDIIRPYVEKIECMRYKIDFNSYPKGFYNLKIQHPTSLKKDDDIVHTLSN